VRRALLPVRTREYMFKATSCYHEPALS